jgi:hypothetical protein
LTRTQTYCILVASESETDISLIALSQEKFNVKLRCSGTPLFKIKNLIYAIDQDHPLIILAKKFDWLRIEIVLCNYYAFNEGRPGYPIRLMVALQILKYIYNLSDENLIKS